MQSVCERFLCCIPRFMKGRLDVDRLTPQHTGWRLGPAIPMLGAAMDGRMDEWTVDARLDECMGGWIQGSRVV